MHAIPLLSLLSLLLSLLSLLSLLARKFLNCASGTLVQSLVHAVLIFCKIIKIGMRFDQWLRRRWGGPLISSQICIPAGSHVHQLAGLGLVPSEVRSSFGPTLRSGFGSILPSHSGSTLRSSFGPVLRSSFRSISSEHGARWAAYLRSNFKRCTPGGLCVLFLNPEKMTSIPRRSRFATLVPRGVPLTQFWGVHFHQLGDMIWPQFGDVICTQFGDVVWPQFGDVICAKSGYVISAQFWYMICTKFGHVALRKATG